MDRAGLIRYITERFSVEEEQPWGEGQGSVFRHPDNRKWFAVGMLVPYSRLGIQREGAADIIDVKTGPLLMGSYLGQPGILPGYHMNKNHWLTVLLDGTASDEGIKELLEISWELTKQTGGGRHVRTDAGK